VPAYSNDVVRVTSLCGELRKSMTVDFILQLVNPNRASGVTSYCTEIARFTSYY
ncbi:hypothetical protein BaRGS_00014144, partial [Batillaria attramentaria]